MIECIFTLDYEIFGSGKGSLAEYVLQPAERLRGLFRRAGHRFVLFPEVAEFELIESAGADPDARSIAQQVRSFHEEGFEVGLHFHPWWYNARRERGQWVLDHSEYNLCTLPPARIAGLIDRGLHFLGGLVGDPRFTPLSYRAGHLLLQPATEVVEALVSRGILIDSSLYKGGFWREHGLDYRPALTNGYSWRFEDDPAIENANGRMLEMPIHTEMVPTWRMLTKKRLGVARRSGGVSGTARSMVDRLCDVRLRRAAKFDYCELTFGEMRSMLDGVIRQDDRDPAVLRPLVVIGHTKELFDLEPMERLIEYLERRRISIATFGSAISQRELAARAQGAQA